MTGPNASAVYLYFVKQTKLVATKKRKQGSTKKKTRFNDSYSPDNYTRLCKILSLGTAMEKQKQNIESVVKGAGKLEPCALLVEM